MSNRIYTQQNLYNTTYFLVKGVVYMVHLALVLISIVVILKILKAGIKFIISASLFVIALSFLWPIVQTYLN